MTRATCDLLLLNFSNYPDLPIFPYAFTQLTALARQRGLRVERSDFLHVPLARRDHALRRLLETTQPAMVGITLRQVDSLMVDSYRLPSRAPFQPLEATRDAIRAIRRMTRAPIVVGGIGFSIHPEKTLQYLEADYGCVGCADDVITSFDAIAAGHPGAGVANLLVRAADAITVPARTYYAPLAEREWDDALVDDVYAFYGTPRMASDAVPFVPVEVMRGCPYRCYFCAEPLVKGTTWRTRSLDVVRDELEFLISRDIRSFWFIASELNIEGAGFPLALGELMIELREKHPARDLIWSGYMLPWKTSTEDFDVLARSGYRLGWNDFQSFSDENLRKTRVPYRMKDLAPFLEASVDPRFLPPASKPGGTVQPMLALFLGNAFTSVTTVAETLRAVDEMELHRYFAQDPLLISALRVFESTPLPASSKKRLMVYPPASASAAEPFLHPTFLYPEELVDHLGGPEAYHRFLAFIGETFLSRAHMARRDWERFLIKAATAGDLASHLAAVSHDDATRELKGAAGDQTRALLRECLVVDRSAANLSRLLYSPNSPHTSASNVAARVLLKAIEQAHAPAAARVLKALGLAAKPASEYRLMAHLYRHHDAVDAVRAMVQARLDLEAGAVELLLLEKLLFENNVVIDPRYRAPLFGA